MLDKDCKILVVDDSTGMRKLIIRKLEEAGYSDFDEAKDGQDAWSKMDSNEVSYDLILSDFHMPNMLGVELLQKIRADDRFKGIPFLLVTARKIDDVISSAVVGDDISEYIQKPFNATKLEEKLTEIRNNLPSD